ncbi:uncharacterized protein LOC118415309 [Branchiostoma floridae]|uniref:Uncharacterized protein LOC118415309 n=1 Tax=Branchiostoma floridae TaxID=7739 RepID=A0A9J7L581_BRAFL|nr:uncharacterized protein LOC118415309 [Branchiostoma floridae]
MTSVGVTVIYFMRRSQTMATTKFDWKTKKKMLDDLEVGNKITPILIDPLQRKWVGPRALAGRFFSKKDEEEQDQEKTINSLKKGTAEDDLVVSEKPNQRGCSTWPSLREIIMDKDGAYKAYILRLQEQTKDHKQWNEILRNFANRLEIAQMIITKDEEKYQKRLAQKEEEISRLSTNVALLEKDNEWERTKAESKIRELEKRFAEQAENTRHGISLKDEELLALKTRVAVLESEKKRSRSFFIIFDLFICLTKQVTVKVM